MKLRGMSGALLLSVVLVAASCSGSNAAADGGTGGGTLATPVTVTMAAAGSSAVASICQSLVLGGGLAYSLEAQSLSACPPGAEAYMSFRLDTISGEYAATAGTIADPGGGAGTAVTFSSTTAGTLGNNGSADEVTTLSAGAAITIETQDRTVTFQFNGNQVTVSAFVKK